MTDPTELVLVAGTKRLVITERMLLALEDVIVSQIAVDDARAGIEPRPLLRLLAADATIEHPIACNPRIFAQTDGRAPPLCRWAERADGGYECQLCAHAIRPGEDRHTELAQLFGADTITPRERRLIAAVLRRIAAQPRESCSSADMAGDLALFADQLDQLSPAALSLVRSALAEAGRE